MKRMLCILLLTAMVFTYSGCVSRPIANQETLPGTSTEPALTNPTEPVIMQLPMTAVSLPITTELTCDDEGNTTFSYSCQTMSLVCPDPDVADKIIMDFLRRMDTHKAAADEMKQNTKPEQGNNFYNVVYNPTRIDQGVLSLYGQVVTYQGWIHPTTICVSANYDLLSGDCLTLGSILTHEDALDPLFQLLIEAITEIKTEKYIMDGFDDILAIRFNANESYDEAWFFDDKGLNFYFSPYEIAPYTSGVITVNIPYEKLTGIIEDKFFPVEKDTANGSIQATTYRDTDMDSLTQIAEVILDQEGEMVLLYTDQSVQDFRLEYGQWNEDGTEFSPTCTVFATPHLTPGDAVMVQSSIPDSMPNLRLSYRSNDEIVSYYLSQSGQDGSVYLTSF